MHAGLVAFVAADMEAARLIVDMGDPRLSRPTSYSAKQQVKNCRAAASPSSLSGSSARWYRIASL